LPSLALTIGHQARVLYICGNLDGGDHVVAKQRWGVGVDDAAAVVHGHVEGVNPGDLKHGDEQGGLVFAIAILVAEDV
jgi:hypothetical protein